MQRRNETNVARDGAKGKKVCLCHFQVYGVDDAEADVSDGNCVMTQKQTRNAYCGDRP